MRLIDFMPLDTPWPTLVRIVEGVRGATPCAMRLAPRMNYGQLMPWTRSARGSAWTATLGPDALCLDAPVERDDIDGSTSARFTVRAGDRVPFVLQWFKPHQPAPEAIDPYAALAKTEGWWRSWSAGVQYSGKWPDAFSRSAIVLKALTYSHTGAIVAAPTTSLPEEIGAFKNWDYRYCWLRDSAYAVDALLAAGFVEEGRQWRDWFLRTYAGRPEGLHIMYGIGGERLEEERTAPWLCGFRGSAPVRIANGAHDQFQLGIYGDVIGTLHRANAGGVEITSEHWTLIEQLLTFVESRWRTPGNGIWETRDSGRQYVDSKVMAWAAIDRALRIAKRCGFDIDVSHWERFKASIHEEVCRAGFDPHRRTFTQYYGSLELDAAILLLPIFGFLPADDPRMRGTIAAIERELVVDGFVFRYSADITKSGGQILPNEGAFVLCTYWLAMNYALAGRDAEARATFERVLAVANDVGLLAEEYDVERKTLLGNFPQAFSHTGLIWTAKLLT
jgi:GH15 family glucan-1,4-alpha-glucosidase